MYSHYIHMNRAMGKRVFGVYAMPCNIVFPEYMTLAMGKLVFPEYIPCYVKICFRSICRAIEKYICVLEYMT